MNNSEGMFGVFLIIAALLTLLIYQGVYWLAYQINWWLGASGFESQSLQFKHACVVVSFFLAIGLMKLCIWVQSLPADPSYGDRDRP